MKNAQKRSFTITVFLFVILILISFYFDPRVASSAEGFRTDFLTSFFLNFGSLGTIFVLIVLLTALFLKENRRKWILPLWVASGLSIVTSFVLKVWVQRPRPFQLGLTSLIVGLEKARYFTWDFSFPSFHTMLIFSTLPFLEKEFPKFRYVWIVLAIVTGFSRIYFGLHFLSDVIAGGLIGYLIGTLMLGHNREGKFWERLYTKIFR